MDRRKALTPGAVLKLAAETGFTLYTINRETGRGGSCIVYDASYTDSLGNFKLVRIKECYPHAMRLVRDQDGTLRAEIRDAGAFAAAKERLIAAYQKNHDLFCLPGLTNAVANTSNLYEAYGTVYIVSTYLNGRTFEAFQGDTLHDCISLVLGTARVLQQIHDAGYLYLDLKPDNILTLAGSLDLVQLFDFDSMISVEDLAAALRGNDPAGLRTSYTRGYAPLEQQTGKLRQLGRHSDLFSLGAVLFHALWHQTPSAFDCAPSAEYDYSCTVYADKAYRDALWPALTEFFHKTLACYPADRYQQTEDAIAQLQIILQLSDETKPWIHSTPIQASPAFYGRKPEISMLKECLGHAKGNTVSLSGMGGIGKSTLARQYLTTHSTDWDAVLWLYDQGDLASVLADDAQVTINTVLRMKEESADEYLRRKRAVLTELAGLQRILLVLDNFEPEHLQQLKPFQNISWTILLISRERLPEGLYPSIRVEELGHEELVRLFCHYAGVETIDETDLSALQTILASIHGHTLLTELIARQVAESFLSIQEAATMVADMGLRDLPEEQIDYIRDQSATHAPLLKILDRLVEIDQFTEEEKSCLKLLSLFDAPGIEASLFRNLSGLGSLDFVHALERSGWLKLDRRQLCLHPVMQEYVRTWGWSESAHAWADRMMRKLYEQIRPDSSRHDVSRQFPADYGSLYRLLITARQMVDHFEEVTEASQHLLYRYLMDSPVDEDTPVMFRMLKLLEDPRYLDADSILRLYETAAYYRARLYGTDEAIQILGEMKRYLLKHPSAYYLSAYHQAMAVILHNANRDMKKSRRHEDQAIAAARLSRHPEAKKQLAACLMNKARTLMSENRDQNLVRRLIREAESLVMLYADPMDYERYQFACNAAMCYAMDGEQALAEKQMAAADEIAFASPDSDLAVAEHLIEEAAPIRTEMRQYDQAEEGLLRAVALCDRHSEALRYRETAFDAYLFLGRIHTIAGDYIKAEAAYLEAEKRLSGTYFAFDLPLCPADISRKAAEQRSKGT